MSKEGNVCSIAAQNCTAKSNLEYDNGNELKKEQK